MLLRSRKLTHENRQIRDPIPNSWRSHVTAKPERVFEQTEAVDAGVFLGRSESGEVR
jgi:hypothetical protein